MKELSIIINKILELDPVSGVSIIFSILFYLFSRFTINSINNSHKSTIEKIEEVYNENMRTMKEILNTYLEKEKK